MYAYNLVSSISDWYSFYLHTHLHVLFVLLYFYILSTNIVYASACDLIFISIDLVFQLIP